MNDPHRDLPPNMPKGRPADKVHDMSYIAVGLAQGFLLTVCLALLISLGL